MSQKRDWSRAKRFRNEQLTIRLSEAERSQIDEMAAAQGITAGALVRQIVLESPIPRSSRRIPPSSLKPELAQLLGQIGKVGSNLNQIAKGINSGQTMAEQLLLRELQDLRSLRLSLRKALLQA